MKKEAKTTGRKVAVKRVVAAKKAIEAVESTPPPVIYDDDESIESSEEDRPRKGPGRPKKITNKREIPRLGIVAAPKNADSTDPRMHNTMEIIYENPDMFKKLFNMFKQFNAKKLNIRFTKNSVIIIATDHVGSIEVKGEIMGSRLNRYYCESEFEHGVDYKTVFRNLKSLKRDHGSICFITTKETQKSQLIMVLHHDTVDEDSNDAIFIDKPETYDENMFKDLDDLDSYPLRFTLDTKYFRDKVNAWLLKSDIVIIEKNPGCPLTIKAPYKDKRGTHETVFKNGDKVDLQCTANDIFAASVHVQRLKSVAAAVCVIADKVQVSVHEEKKITFTCLMDSDTNAGKAVVGTETCRVQILTSIVDVRG